MEIAKQMYDVCTLLDEAKDFSHVRETYVAVAKSEASYRGLPFDINSFLTDTYNAAACIASRGRMFPEDFPLLVKGIRDVKNHVFGERYNAEIAAIRAVKDRMAGTVVLELGGWRRRWSGLVVRQKGRGAVILDHGKIHFRPRRWAF